MKFANMITPKNTEKIKPGLFIQKVKNTITGNEEYRHIYPAAWNGKINWSNFLFGGKPIATFILLFLIIFIPWSYQNDIKEYQDFYYKTHANPQKFCTELNEMNFNSICIPKYEKEGLCVNLERLKENPLDIGIND